MQWDRDMLIILEGTDCAGKSTFADVLVKMWLTGFSRMAVPQEDRKVIRFHKGPPDERHILDQYELDLEKNLEAITSDDTLVICDRWHVGEWIYGPLLRGQSRLDKAQLVHIELLLEALGAVYAIVTADPGSLERRHKERPDPLVDWSTAYSIQTRYLEYATCFRWPIIMMNDKMREYWIDRKAKELLSRAISQAAASQQLKPFWSYIGHQVPWTLLVGDAPGGTPLTDHPRAFMPLNREGCPAAFLESLWWRSKDWRRYGLVNQSGTDLLDLWWSLSCPEVIALGQRAGQAVKASGITQTAWRVVRHPQYVRRFASAEWDPYVHGLFNQAAVHV